MKVSSFLEEEGVRFSRPCLGLRVLCYILLSVGDFSRCDLCLFVFMADTLSSLWKNFSLSEEESLGVAVLDQVLPVITDRGRACVVGKLFADRIIGKEVIKSTLIKGWRPSGMTSFKVLGENIFLVEFEHLWDTSRVLEGRPWVFEGSLFAVVDFSGTVPPAEMNFEKVSFWVQMFNLPLAFMSETMGVSLGNSVGVVEEVESDEYGIGWGEYLRIKICLDISKPLARGRILKLKETITWVAFQYERLPRFCFQCGAIRHGPAGCLVPGGGIMAGVSHKQQFGS